MPSFDTAFSLARSGNPREALAEAMAAHAVSAESIDLLGLIAELHTTLNDPGAAAQYFRRIASLTPDDPAAHRRLAGAEFSAGSAGAAIDAYRRALELDPRNVRAHNNLGRALEQAGNLNGAAECYRQALSLDESYSIAHNNLGNILAGTGQHPEALTHFQRALQLRPDLVEAWVNCAKTLLEMKRPADALACTDQAVTLRPDFAEGWFVRGGILNELERSEEALACCDRAITLHHDYPEAVYARANLFRAMGERREAVAGFREALRLKPDYESARMAAVVAEVPALPWTATEVADSRDAFGRALAELEANLEYTPCRNATALVGATQPFYIAYQEEDNRALLSAHGRLCASLMGEWQRHEGLESAPRGRSAQSRLRVAFVSAQISDHSVYNAITRGWLQCLDRRRFAIEVFHLGGKADAATHVARNSVDHFAQGPRTIREWARLIVDRCPDVLIYPEVGMDQTTLQLAGMRLAPAQVLSWGHPVTSGLPTLDYYLSADAFEPADSGHHYTERLVRLPHFGAYYEPSRPAGDGMRTISAAGVKRPFLVCAGTPFKYLPQFDTVLVDIARRLGRCQFQFFEYRDGVLSRRLLNRLHDAFSAAGLDGAEYLALRPWAAPSEFHEILTSADLFLDTLGFSGFNTVMQALECGLPVVSYRGRFMRGRLGTGILERLSLSDLVADTPRAYVDTVVSLAENSAARSQVRDRLRRHLPRAYRDQSVIDALQEFLIGIV